MKFLVCLIAIVGVSYADKMPSKTEQQELKVEEAVFEELVVDAMVIELAALSIKSPEGMAELEATMELWAEMEIRAAEAAAKMEIEMVKEVVAEGKALSKDEELIVEEKAFMLLTVKALEMELTALAETKPEVAAVLEAGLAVWMELEMAAAKVAAAKEIELIKEMVSAKAAPAAVAPAQ